MNQLIGWVIPNVMVFITSFMNALIMGSILWISYPSIGIMFPILIKMEIIAESIAWWNAVFVSWILIIILTQAKSIIINNTSTSK